MNAVKENDVKWLELPGRRCRVMIGGNHLKANNITFGITEIPPRSKVSPHKHEQEEVIYILQGYGEVLIDGKTERIEEGTGIYLPGNSEHCIENKSDVVMRFTFAFSPPVKIGSYG